MKPVDVKSNTFIKEINDNSSKFMRISKFVRISKCFCEKLCFKLV